MSHYGILGNYRFQEATEDIRGAHLYGLEGDKLGKIEDVIFDHSSGTIRYIVVDTGGWLSTKEFVVPADRLRASAKHDGDFESDLTTRSCTVPKRIGISLRLPSNCRAILSQSMQNEAPPVREPARAKPHRYVRPTLPRAGSFQPARTQS